MSHQDIAVALDGRVLTITLNRPDRLNAWTHRMESEFRQAVEAGEADQGVRAIVVTGAGRGFCAGADMDILEAGAAGANSDGSDATANASEAAPGIEANYAWRFSYLLRVRKPIFAAINGPIAGIGLCFALYCDLRLMADGARLTTAFARRGLIAEWGSAWVLPRLVGTARALDLLMSARTFVAEEALEMGLLNAVHPADELLDRVLAYATDLAVNASPTSLAIIKQQVYADANRPLAAAEDQAIVLMRESLEREDFAEGVASFVERRPPSFAPYADDPAAAR